MRFGKVVDHLSKRGFATRKSWRGRFVVFFGVDNSLWLSDYEKYRSDNPNIRALALSPYHPNLQEMGADDWVPLPYFWNGPVDDYEPFRKKDPTLKAFRDLELVVRHVLAPRKARVPKKGGRKC